MPDYKILVVDEEEVSRTFLYRDLQTGGYQSVKSVDSVEDALQLLKKSSVDLIITEIKFHQNDEMDGINLLKSVRKRKVRRPNSDKPVAILVLTAYADLKYAVESGKSGADDFMSKPYEVSDLLSTVNRLLEP